MSFLNQNFSLRTASRLWARCRFSSTLMGKWITISDNVTNWYNEGTKMNYPSCYSFSKVLDLHGWTLGVRLQWPGSGLIFWVVSIFPQISICYLIFESSKPTFDIGMRRFNLKERMTRVSNTTNTTYAAFSKSVNCTWRYKDKIVNVYKFRFLGCWLFLLYKIMLLRICYSLKYGFSIHVYIYLEYVRHYLCWSELHPPSNWSRWWWGFKPHCLPICRLNILKFNTYKILYGHKRETCKVTL